jgi:hypothetical protein
MRVTALGLNAIHVTHRLLQEVQRQPGLPEPLRAEAGLACIGYPSLSMVREELWTLRKDEALAWLTALSRARLVLDQLLELQSAPDIQELARYAGRYFPRREQIAGAQVVRVPDRGWTLELGE